MLGCIRLSLRSRLRYACRQRRIIDIATARAVNIAGNQHFAMKSLAELADAAEVGDWLTQIIQIIMIFCANLSRQREVIPATCHDMRSM